MPNPLNGQYPALSATNISHSTEQLHASEVLTLGALAAIWGASFILMRLVVPDLGAIFTADIRILIAALALLGFAHARQIPLAWRLNLKAYALAGLFGAALPFALFCYAAQHLPAAMSALLNATSPLFGAFFAIAVWRTEQLNPRKFIGLLLGLVGVALLLSSGAPLNSNYHWLAITACLAAPACFALSAIVVKLHTCHTSNLSRPDRITPIAMAAGSMTAAAVIILPSLPFFLPAHLPSTGTLGLVVALALIPSALAQILYIPLVTKMGATRAMSVAFLIPVFSALWGFLFLHESIGIFCALGGLIVLAGIRLILTT